MNASRKRGRPALTAGHSARAVNVKLPIDMHDRVCVVALRNGVSVAAIMREGLRRLLKDERGFSIEV